MAGDGLESGSEIPALGSGLGYRRELRQSILESRGSIDFLEIVADQFLHDPIYLDELAEIRELFVVIPHGVGLSVGSPRVDGDYLRAIRRISEVARSPYYSEHLAMTRAPGIDLGHLSPLWFTESLLRVTEENVKRVQDCLGKPLVLENVTYSFDVPAAGMRQSEFFTRLVKATDCWMLLDVTNLYINSVNHRFDPAEFLRELPLHRIAQIHLAGGYKQDGVWIDGHCESVDEGSWRLLDTLALMAPIRSSIIERDSNFPNEIADLLLQIGRARAAIARSGGLRANRQ